MSRNCVRISCFLALFPYLFSHPLFPSHLASRNPSQEIDIGEVSSLYEVMPDPLPPMDLNGPLGKHKKSEGRVPHMFTVF